MWGLRFVMLDFLPFCNKDLKIAFSDEIEENLYKK